MKTAFVTLWQYVRLISFIMDSLVDLITWQHHSHAAVTRKFWISLCVVMLWWFWRHVLTLLSSICTLFLALVLFLAHPLCGGHCIIKCHFTLSLSVSISLLSLPFNAFFSLVLRSKIVTISTRYQVKFFSIFQIEERLLSDVHETIWFYTNLKCRIVKLFNCRNNSANPWVQLSSKFAVW